MKEPSLPTTLADRFEQKYESELSETARQVQYAVFGALVDSNGYTTVSQADELGDSLDLGPGVRLLELGCGRGWPGIYFAQSTGCEVMLTDIPFGALRQAAISAKRKSVDRQCLVAAAGGKALPFRRGVFDAIVHADVLC